MGGSSDMGGTPPPPSSPPPPPEGGTGLTPESTQKDNLKILLENDGFLEEEMFIDLSKGKNQLGIIEVELKKLLGE